METPKVLSINPGDGECFPWLSNIAPNFEYYVINSLSFHYKSSVSSFTQGSIALTPEYDPHNHKLGAPLSLAEMLNKEGAVKGNVWTDTTLMVPKKRSGLQKLVRPEHHLTRTSEHLRQTELGHLYVALYNIGNADIVGAYGDLYVEYDVTLRSPNFTNKSVKTHVITTPETYMFSNGGQLPPLLGDERSPPVGLVIGDDFDYYGHPNSTLGVTCCNQTVGNIPLTGDVNATRLRFEEPFHGKLTYTLTNHLGSMNSSAEPKVTSELSNFTYFPGSEPEKAARFAKQPSSKSGGTGADWTWVWDVVAAAGDVLDLSFDSPGNLIADLSELTLTDVAFGLLDIALL